METIMEKKIGLLRIRVRRGINLAIRDAVRNTSDPYVVFSMGCQKLKTRVIKSKCNPQWNEELSLTVTDPNIPIRLTVYDKDTLSDDDNMGIAEIDIRPYLECLQKGLGHLLVGTSVQKIQPDENNCLADESRVVWMGDGRVVQDMILRLQNVESGEVQLQIEWNDIPECNFDT